MKVLKNNIIVLSDQFSAKLGVLNEINSALKQTPPKDSKLITYAGNKKVFK